LGRTQTSAHEVISRADIEQQRLALLVCVYRLPYGLVPLCFVKGRREIEGVTPKQLPARSPVSVENNDQLICVEKPSQNSASDDQ
jgi:hypothetical protein